MLGLHKFLDSMVELSKVETDLDEDLNNLFAVHKCRRLPM